MDGEEAFRDRCKWLSDAATWTAGLLWAAIAVEIIWQAWLKRALGYGGGDFNATIQAVGREAVESLSAICLVGSLGALGRVFGKMGRGQVLIADNAIGLVRAGEWVVSAAIAQTIVQPLVLGVLGDGDGPRISFSWEALALGLFGAALILLGDVLRTAARAQRELDQIV